MMATPTTTVENEKLREQVLELAVRVHQLENDSQAESLYQKVWPVADGMRNLLDLLGLNQGTGGTATKVFDIPELLEMILLNLEPRDVFVAMQACRQFRDVTNISRALQRHIFLACDPDTSKMRFRSPLASAGRDRLCLQLTPLSYCSDESLQKLMQDQTGDLDAQSSDPRLFSVVIPAGGWCRTKNPSMGERARWMLVCQPPITRLTVSVNCCSRHREAVPGTTGNSEPLCRDSGITVGDVMDAVRNAQALHRLCPFAKPKIHDMNGYVDVDPELSGLLRLSDGDPDIREAPRRHWRSYMHRSWLRCRRSKLADYAWAKQDAYKRGEPIPTPEEAGFQETFGEYLRRIPDWW